MEVIRSNWTMWMNSLVVVLGWITTTVRGHDVPSMFIFGDSLADAGNNNYLPNEDGRGNFTPYGISYFPQPTGRFTNGRTAFDFIASMLEFPFFIPPYLEPNANFTKGVNFASGGSGFLNETGAKLMILNMSYQITQFENFSELLINEHGAEEATSYLGKSLYFISSGGNDISTYFQAIFEALGEGSTTIPTDPEEFISLLLEDFEKYVRRLYAAGARKFVVLDIPAVGYTPVVRLILSNFSICEQERVGSLCFDIVNYLPRTYNPRLKSLVHELNGNLTGATISVVYTFDSLTNIIENGENYGFSETKSACCGWGRFNTEVGCGKTDPPALFCDDPDSYVFWDGIHPTEKFYDLISQEIWSGGSSVIYPFNLSTLITLEGNTYDANLSIPLAVSI